MPRIYVKHNIEVAHRLSKLPGKCQNIHGHSMMITLTLSGELNANGILEGQDFSTIKQAFRAHLDSDFDHHLLLNEKDKWAQEINGDFLPGLTLCDADPTVENIAKWIYKAMQKEAFGLLVVAVDVAETGTNGAGFDK